MEQIAIFLILLSLGYVVGSIQERRHYHSIREREKAMAGLPVLNVKGDELAARAAEGHLVVGSVVVSIDYFKKVAAALRNLFGGRISAYETLVDRGRREAILRMKEAAGDAELIMNMKVETSVIGQNAGQKHTVGSVEVMAYGTALFKVD